MEEKLFSEVTVGQQRVVYFVLFLIFHLCFSWKLSVNALTLPVPPRQGS